MTIIQYHKEKLKKISIYLDTEYICLETIHI